MMTTGIGTGSTITSMITTTPTGISMGTALKQGPVTITLPAWLAISTRI
jgi:hypothetical protein